MSVTYTPSLDTIFEHLKQDAGFVHKQLEELERLTNVTPIVSPKPRRPKPKPQTPEWVQLLPRLYLGNQAFADDFHLLQQHSIQRVVSCRELLLEDQLVSHPGIVYARIWADDQPHVGLHSVFYRTDQWIMNVSPESPVLIHCQQGVSRSVTLACVHVMNMMGYDDKEALQHIRTVRPCINPNEGFLKQLSDYFATRKEYWSAQSAMMCTELCMIYQDQPTLIDIIHLCLGYLGKFHSSYFTYWPSDSSYMDCPS